MQEISKYSISTSRHLQYVHTHKRAMEHSGAQQRERNAFPVFQHVPLSVVWAMECLEMSALKVQSSESAPRLFSSSGGFSIPA